MRIAESELILNQRGAVYHLDTTPPELAETIITVGDPDRVAAVSKYFDTIEVKNQHREFVTHTGFIGNKRITCVSTGIGTDNIDIVLNELDALANINFTTRTENVNKKVLKIIRLGTSGSLQKDIPVDSFVVSTHGLGIDNLLNFYILQNNTEEQQLLSNFLAHTHLENKIAVPYISASAINLMQHFVTGYQHGITVTCPGFYAPQGRVLRAPLRHHNLIDQLTNFSYGNHRITNFEMETAGIYGLGAVLGHQCLSISAIVANRVSQTFSKDGAAAVETLIKNALETIITHIA
jgi:uridine phosphorylase